MCWEQVALSLSSISLTPWTTRSFTMIRRIVTILSALFGTLLCSSHGFLQPTSYLKKNPTKHSLALLPNQLTWTYSRYSTTTSTTTLMSYNLPPSRNKKGVVFSVLTLLGLIAFLSSPLGTIFFAIVNSLLVFALLLPLAVIVAFQTWQFFYTTERPCPNCNTPVRFLNDGSPSICLNCGSIVMCSNEGCVVEVVSESTTPTLLEEVYGETAWGSLLPSSPIERKLGIIDVVYEEEEDEK